MTQKRVVITGMGLMTPAGGSMEEYWDCITSGRSALRKITHFDVTGFPSTIAGEVDDSLLTGEIPQIEEDADRALLLAVHAAAKALKDADLNPSAAKRPVGLCLGSGAGPTQAAEISYLAYSKRGVRGVRPRTVIRTMFNSLSAHLGIYFGLKGPQLTVAAACTSANSAMARAVDLVRQGRIDQILTGGAEMPVCETVVASWSAMRILSVATDPQACCLPFDKRRCGIVLAEGAALYVFEEYEHAKARGAKIYAEILGYGENNDATHITFPDPASQARAITAALEDAQCRPEDIGYINAHGTGTDANDVAESEAITTAFGEWATRVPVSSTKSVIGHGLGASGALELPAVIGALQRQMLPPTANLREIDPRCKLDYVPCAPREAAITTAISNSFAFGGANTVLVLRRPEQ